MKQKIYLENTPLNEALKKWTDKLTSAGINKPLEGETIEVINSLGRITAEAVIARVSSPFYHSAAMDGYAVRFADTVGASEKTPKQLSLPEQAVYAATGNPMPEGFDAVIMIEDVNIIRGQGSGVKGQKPENTRQKNSELRTPNSELIEIIAPATPWQHVRTVGEDIVVTELILPENHKIRAIDIGAMLAGGFTEIKVRRKPRVVIIPSGDELVEPGSRLLKGNIIESNSRILTSLVTEWGGEPVRRPIVPDSEEELKKALLDAIKTGDLIVINAGASAGRKDFTSQVITYLGEVILHGVNIKPGKPVILGWINDKPVLGIPGYPVSAFITFELFAKPVVHTWLGTEMHRNEILTARLSRQLSSTLGVEEFVRVKVGKVGDNIIASPVSRGAGMLMSLVRADGFVRIPAMSEGLGAGTKVDVELLEDNKDKISNTIVCIGSHDNILDVLANFLKRKYPEYSLSSAHVGSLGGLIALKRGEAHMAGTHLLDEETGEYNVPFIKRLFNNNAPVSTLDNNPSVPHSDNTRPSPSLDKTSPSPHFGKGGTGGLSDDKIMLINLVYRQQGLLVLKGNPKKIRGFKDLIRGDITFINRQPGSGTRLLTDKYLKDLHIDPGKIKGYDREEYTHMTVASAVLNGIADTGLGILAAARALGLDFIPLAKERYDLAVPEKVYTLEMLRKLMDIIRNDSEFRELVEGLGGYDASDMGKIVYSG